MNFDDSEDAGRRRRRQILDLQERKVEFKEAYWSYTLTGLVLLRIGKPLWFWLPVALLGIMAAGLYAQTIAVAVIALIVLVLVEWYEFFAWPGWVEEHNGRIDAEIDRLRAGGDR